MRRVGARVELLPARRDALEAVGEVVQARAGRAELVAVLVVVALEPARAGAEDEAALAAARADVVDRAGHVGLQVGVAVAVAVDEAAELDALGLLGPRAEHRPRLEVQAVGIAREREEVVPVEEDVDAEVFDAAHGVAQLRVGDVLGLQLHAEAHGGVERACGQPRAARDAEAPAAAAPLRRLAAVSARDAP